MQMLQGIKLNGKMILSAKYIHTGKEAAMTKCNPFIQQQTGKPQASSQDSQAHNKNLNQSPPHTCTQCYQLYKPASVVSQYVASTTDHNS